MKPFYSKIPHTYWFWIGILVLFVTYNYFTLLFLPPHSIHAWRQSDCLSLAANFMDENNPFHPAIHNFISDGGTSGKSAGEFTLLYYVVGKIWNIFGIQPAIYRIIQLGIFLMACFSLFKTLYVYWNSIFWSFFTSMLLFTSPLIVFYAPNFLTDSTALSCSIFASVFLLNYFKTKNEKQLVYAFILFSLASLFKITAGISFISLGGIIFLDAFGVFKKKIFVQNWKLLLYFSLCSMLIFAWYYYAEYYNSLHGGKYTFNNLWPIWELSADNYAKAILFFKEITFTQFYHPVFSYLLVISLIVCLLVAFIKAKALFLFLLFQMIGSTLYVLFWFGALENHDYYFINLFMLPLLVVFVLTHQLLNSTFYKLWKKPIISIMCVLFFFNVVYASANIRLRYSEKMKSKNKIATYLYDKKQVDYWNYTSSTYQNDGLFDMEKYNRKVGIKKEDLIICYPDPSFNISLFLLKQKGFTSFNNSLYDSIPVKNQINNGAKYLIINKTFCPNLVNLQAFMNDSIGFHKGYTIYKLPKVN